MKTGKSQLTVTLIAAGGMGSAMGRRLVENGARVMTSLAERSSASATRAREAGMEAASDDALMEAGIFLSVVPPAAALPLARRFAPFLSEASTKPVYVDCNAVSPDTVQEIAEVIAATGAGFVDAGIIGGPPKPGTHGPSIYCSGPAAGALRILNHYGLRTREIEGPIGAASALKMSYAGITKGLIAVASAMVLGATRAGADKALLQELAESQPQLLNRLQTMVPSVYSKAHRWVAEMEEIAKFLDSVPDAGGLYRGAAGLYRHLADEFPEGADIATLEAFFQSSEGGNH